MHHEANSAQSFKQRSRLTIHLYLFRVFNSTNSPPDSRPFYLNLEHLVASMGKLESIFFYRISRAFTRRGIIIASSRHSLLCLVRELVA
jgi:hypothetical protein